MVPGVPRATLIAVAASLLCVVAALTLTIARAISPATPGDQPELNQAIEPEFGPAGGPILAPNDPRMGMKSGASDSGINQDIPPESGTGQELHQGLPPDAADAGGGPDIGRVPLPPVPPPAYFPGAHAPAAPVMPPAQPDLPPATQLVR